MWDETRPLKLMKALSFDAFSMQHIIDTDKYFAGEINGPICAEDMRLSANSAPSG